MCKQSLALYGIRFLRRDTTGKRRFSSLFLNIKRSLGHELKAKISQFSFVALTQHFWIDLHRKMSLQETFSQNAFFSHCGDNFSILVFLTVATLSRIILNNIFRGIFQCVSDGTSYWVSKPRKHCDIWIYAHLCCNYHLIHTLQANDYLHLPCNSHECKENALKEKLFALYINSTKPGIWN